jgi:hypothetical protein
LGVTARRLFVETDCPSGRRSSFLRACEISRLPGSARMNVHKCTQLPGTSGGVLSRDSSSVAARSEGIRRALSPVIVGDGAVRRSDSCEPLSDRSSRPHTGGLSSGGREREGRSSGFGLQKRWMGHPAGKFAFQVRPRLGELKKWIEFANQKPTERSVRGKRCRFRRLAGWFP